MRYYYDMYINVMKKNFMLVIIAVILLFPTFFIWAGVPFFLVSNALNNIMINQILVYLGISISGSLIFSLYFLPINLKVAQNIAITRKSSVLHSFLKLKISWIIVGAVIWGFAIVIIS